LVKPVLLNEETMLLCNRKAQGESLIKILVVAIIAIIAIALAKSYFREASRTTQQTIQDVYGLPNTIILPLEQVTSILALNPPS